MSVSSLQTNYDSQTVIVCIVLQYKLVVISQKMGNYKYLLSVCFANLLSVTQSSALKRSETLATNSWRSPCSPFQQLYKWRCPLLLRQTEESPRPTLLTSRHLYSSSAADGRSTFAGPPSPSLLPRLICWVMHCLAHTPPILRKATILRHKSSGEQLTDKKYKVAERVRVGSRARVARSRSQGSTRERSRGATLSIIFATQYYNKYKLIE